MTIAINIFNNIANNILLFYNSLTEILWICFMISTNDFERKRLHKK